MHKVYNRTIKRWHVYKNSSCTMPDLAFWCLTHSIFNRVRFRFWNGKKLDKTHCVRCLNRRGKGKSPLAPFSLISVPLAYPLGITAGSCSSNSHFLLRSRFGETTTIHNFSDTFWHHLFFGVYSHYHLQNFISWSTNCSIIIQTWCYDERS